MISRLPGAVGNHHTITTQEELLALAVRTLTVNSLGADVQHLHLADTVGTKIGFGLRTCSHLDVNLMLTDQNFKS